MSDSLPSGKDGKEREKKRRTKVGQAIKPIPDKMAWL